MSKAIIEEEAQTSNASTSDPTVSPMDELTIQNLIMKTTKAKEGPLEQYTMDPRFFRIPKVVYETNPDAYRPRHFSIGPVHHVDLGLNNNHPNEANLSEMELIKYKAMLRLLQYYLDPEDKPEEILSTLKEWVMRHLDSIGMVYNDHLHGNYSREGRELIGRIILVDALFLLEFFIRMSLGKESPDYPDKDDHNIFWSLRRDAALLENQLPLFVMQELLQILYPKVIPQLLVSSTDPRSRGMYCAMLELVRLTPDPPIISILYHVPNCEHLLDLVMCCHLFTPEDRDFSQWKSKDVPRWIQLQSATQLNAAGVKFQRAEGAIILALKFSNGVLTIPALVIHDSTETLLLNILAYERLNPIHFERYPIAHLASYVLLMSQLVETKKDLEFLQNQGIIVNELGIREDGSKIFHNISTQPLLAPFYFQGLCENIEAYVNSRRTRYFIDLKRRYFQNPWTAISLFAAVVLLLLTTLQTVYTILSFYK